MSDSGSFKEYRTKTTGMPVYTLTARDRLAQAMNPNLTADPNPAELRGEAVIAAKAAVDAAWPVGEMQGAASAVFAAGIAQAEEIERQRADMREDAFERWKNNADDRFCEYLLSATESFKAIVDKARAIAPVVAKPFPVTSPDIMALGVRLQQLDTANPVEALALVDDAIARKDAPFLIQTASNVRSWITYRGSWQGAKDIAQAITEKISAQAWTPQSDASAYANDRADRSVAAWRLIVQEVQNNLRVDPIYRTVGAFSPIFEATA